MKEHPILFSTPMVKAILEGRRTQTRRVAKGTVLEWLGAGFTPEYVADPDNNLCPYGELGDRLWVRETFCKNCFVKDNIKDVCYKEDLTRGFKPCDKGCKFTPSIHMPRWASRITLEITDIRVQKVQDISENDVKAEGVLERNSSIEFTPLIADFETLWNTINEKRGYSWEKNPWVWAITFKRIN